MLGLAWVPQGHVSVKETCFLVLKMVYRCSRRSRHTAIAFIERDECNDNGTKMLWEFNKKRPIIGGAGKKKRSIQTRLHCRDAVLNWFLRGGQVRGKSPGGE